MPRAPAALVSPVARTELVGQHRFELRLIRGIRNGALVELPLARTRLAGQDVTCKGVIANNFASARLLEALRRTLVSLQLRHFGVTSEGIYNLLSIAGARPNPCVTYVIARVSGV